MSLPSAKPQPLRLFYSYSHEDERMRQRLEAHLKLFEREGLISPWHFRKIGAGEEWEGAIDKHLVAADIVLLLITASFLASTYCYDVEMKRALRRHKLGRARVIPIILRDVDWKIAPFSILQALPTGGKPITAWRPQDKGWADVAKGIRDTVKVMQSPAAPAVAPKKTQVVPVTATLTKTTQPKPRTRQQLISAPTKPDDFQTMLDRAEKLFSARNSDYTTRLCLVVAGDAAQVIRPAALTVSLGETIREHLRAGRTRLLDPADATKVRVEGDAVVLEQQPHVSILADQQGSVRLISAVPQRTQGYGFTGGVVEEDVREHLALMLRAADRVLKDIDSGGVMSEVVILGGLFFSLGLGWKTAEEYARNAQSWTSSMKSGPLRVQLTPPQRPRTAISREATSIAADFTALFRRQLLG